MHSKFRDVSVENKITLKKQTKQQQQNTTQKPELICPF